MKISRYIWSFFLYILFKQSVLCSIQYLDTVQNIQQGKNIKIKDFTVEQEIQQSDYIVTVSIPFSSSFLNKPSILIGINRYDNFYDQFFINFQLLMTSITTSSFNVQLTVFKGTCLYGIFLNYLAIDTSIYTNYYISPIIEKPVTMQLSGSFYSTTFYTSFQTPATSKLQKKVQVFLVGFSTIDETGQNYQMDRFSIYFSVLSQDTNGFTVQVQQMKGTVGTLLLNKVRFNYLEVDDDPYGTLQTDILNFDQFLDATSANCLMDPYSSSVCGGASGTTQFERYQSVLINLSHSFTPSTTNVFQIFAGLNTFTTVQYDTTNILKQYNPRFQMVNYAYPTSSSVQFQYYVWYYTECPSIASYGLMIFQKSCTGSGEILNGNTCISNSSNCDAGTYLQNNICTPCNSNCSTCSTSSTTCTSCSSSQYLVSNVCQTTQPSGYYCQMLNSNNYYTCTVCADSNCVQCSSTSSNSCTSCASGYYLASNLCYASQPSGYYCQLLSSNSHSCTACVDSNCAQCSSASSNTCTQCNSGYQYIYNGQCYNSQPQSTYCDPTTNICSSCTNSLCSVCLVSLSQCRTCISSAFYFEQNCYQTQPSQSTCVNKICSSSGTCVLRDSTGKCTLCASGNYILNNACYTQQPQNSCCDSTLSCINSTIQNCQYCTTISQLLFVCKQCQSGYYSFNNQCTLIQPDNTYCNSSQNCAQCPSSLANCKYCSNPTPSNYTCLQCEEGYSLLNNQCLTPLSSTNSCHYSCGNCYGSDFNECSSCSSTTREFSPSAYTCSCKAGYSDITQTVDCWDDSLQPNSLLSNLSNYAVYLYFLMSLILVILNFHSFTDAFINTFQMIGNFALVSAQVRRLLGIFTIYNYLNIKYNKNITTPTLEKVSLFGVLEFNSFCDQQVADDLLFFVTLFFTIVLISFVVNFTGRRRQANFSDSKAHNYIFWNVFIKYTRIFSSYFYMQIFERLFNHSLLSSQSPLSIIIFIFTITLLFVFVFFGYCLVLRKESSIQQQSQNSYLNSNLIIPQNAFHRHFWLILEGRKIICAIVLTSLDLKIGIFFMIILSFILSILFVNFKPYRSSQLDSFYLIINEVALITFSIVTLTYVYQGNEEQEFFLSYKNAYFILTLIIICIHISINIEYFIRLIVEKRKLKGQNKDTSRSQYSNSIEISVQDLSWVKNKFKRSTLISTPKQLSLKQ